MSDLVKVAFITGAITLVNGPLLIALLGRKWKRNDELVALKGELKTVSKILRHLGNGLDIGLRNDRVIFRALREHSINGESEEQEKIMEEYFTRCTIAGFKSDKGE